MGKTLLLPHYEELKRLGIMYKKVTRYNGNSVFLLDSLNYLKLKRLVVNYIKRRLETEKGNVMSIKLRHIENYYGVKLSQPTMTVILEILAELGGEKHDGKSGKRFVFNVRKLRRRVANFKSV